MQVFGSKFSSVEPSRPGPLVGLVGSNKLFGIFARMLFLRFVEGQPSQFVFCFCCTIEFVTMHKVGPSVVFVVVHCLCGVQPHVATSINPILGQPPSRLVMHGPSS